MYSVYTEQYIANFWNGYFSDKGGSDDKGGLTTGAIVGIVIGAIVVIALIAGGVYYFFYQSKAQKPKIRRDTNIDTNM